MPEIDWKRRALAAEKSVAVLKRKVTELYNGDQSIIGRQLEKAREREARNRQRRALAEMRSAQLEAYSAQLEGEVAERTRAIQTILDNVTFGFLVVGPDLVVQEGCTRSCVPLLGSSTIVGRRLPELLGVGNGTALLTYELAFEEVFEDIMPEEVLLAQLPGRFEVGHRVLRVEGRCIRDDSGAVVSVLMTISDITQLEAAQRENETNLALISILKQREAFIAFLSDARAQLQAARRGVESGAEALVRRVVHTIKGNAASYGMHAVASTIHRVEEAATIDHEGLDAVERAIRAFLDAHQEVLELDYDLTGDDTWRVSLADIEQLKRLAGDLGSPRLQQWTTALLEKPASALMGPLGTFVQRMAARLEKEVSFELIGAEVMVDSDTMRPVFRSLPHLLRNAIDHGIEAPYERGDKPEVAHLSVEVCSDASAWSVTIRDDGRGINVERLVERARQLGQLPEQPLSWSEKLALIFVDGLSSAEQASDISGRGVGMSAVREAVHEQGGRISVSSKPGEGTSVVITVPRPALFRRVA